MLEAARVAAELDEELGQVELEAKAEEPAVDLVPDMADPGRNRDWWGAGRELLGRQATEDQAAAAEQSPERVKPEGKRAEVREALGAEAVLRDSAREEGLQVEAERRQVLAEGKAALQALEVELGWGPARDRRGRVEAGQVAREQLVEADSAGEAALEVVAEAGSAGCSLAVWWEGEDLETNRRTNRSWEFCERLPRLERWEQRKTWLPRRWNFRIT